MELRMIESQASSGTGSQPVVEVWDGQRVVATIHTTEDGVRVVSEGLTAIHRSYNEPQAVTVILR